MAGIGNPFRWACKGCVHATNKKRVPGRGTVYQCVCELSGHAYGNVVRCPHRKERE